jgi:hypothetical protein
MMRASTVFMGALLLLTGCTARDVTKAEISRLRPGMTYRQVVAVVGSEGRLLRPGEQVLWAAVPSAGVSVYLWANADGSLANASFDQGYLVGWGEHGL